MRNLKKILALVLALVMSLSLMATAGASSFPDVDAENPYATAIEVLDELKVFQGFDDGTFKPTDTLNRAQAAVLVYRIATGDVENKYLDNYTFMQQSKFTDLDGYNWAKGYINYCQNAGIVVGTTATTFDPGAKVTGYQLLVMLLRTLGYGKAGEFADPKGWELQTATIAEREGITKNVTAGDFGAAAPRQMVAEILFRGLLSESVEYSALIPGGYTKTGVTLGMREFGLEQISGVVMANEWANLNDGAAGEKVLAAGTTQMKLEDGKSITVNKSTDLDAVGLTYNAYIADGGENGTKRALTLEEGANTVAFNEGKATGPDTDYSANRAWASIQKLADEESISINDSTEYFVNYDQAWNEDCTSDYQIGYVVKWDNAKATAFAAVADNADAWKAAMTAAKADVNGGTLQAAAVAGAITRGEYEDLVEALADAAVLNTAKTEYSKSIRPDKTITEDDQLIMQYIFYVAGRYGDNDENQVKDYSIGEVYVGTTERKDYSDTMSWKGFKAEYFNDTLTSRRFTSAENGESLRVIDNNNDGAAEYVLKIEYVQDKVVGSYKDAALLNSLRVADYSGNNLYNPDEIAAGDVVNYTTIDNKLSIWKADVLTDVVKTKHFNNITITTDGGEDKGQSGITNATGMDQLIMMMDEKVEYNMYLDEFGFVRSYELAQGSQYALLTELYPTGNQNYNYVKSFKGIAEMKIGEADIDEYNIANSDGSVFFSDSVWTIGTRGYWNSNLYNYLQPAVAHLGNPGKMFANYYAGATNSTGVYKVPAWNRIVTGIQSQPNSAPAYYGVFDYDSINYTKDQSAAQTPVAGTAPATFSFTNVAAYSLDSDNNVTLKSASQLSYNQDGDQMYRVGEAAATAAGAVKSTDPLAKGTIGTKDELIAAYAKVKGITETAATNDWWNVFSIYTNGKGIYPVYKVDYVQLEKQGVKANTVHYTIDGQYDSLYNTWSNSYVNATVNTEFYIVMPNGVQYKVGFSELPTIAEEKVRAAYAVATNTNANASGRDYWVADVIVIEVDGLEYSYDSISLMYYNPRETTGSVRYVNSLNNEWRALQPDSDEKAKITVIPDETNETGAYTGWGNQSWTADAYGFYTLYNTEMDEGGDLLAADAQMISKEWNSYGIYAGTIQRTERLVTSGYIDVDTLGRTNLPEEDKYVLPYFVGDAPFYRVTRTSASDITLTPVNKYSDVQLDDEVIIVYNKAKNTVAYVVDLGSRKDYDAPAWLLDGDDFTGLAGSQWGVNTVATYNGTNDATSLYCKILWEQQNGKGTSTPIGDYTVTIKASYTDALGVAQTKTLKTYGVAKNGQLTTDAISGLSLDGYTNGYTGGIKINGANVTWSTNNDASVTNKFNATVDTTVGGTADVIYFTAINTDIEIVVPFTIKSNNISANAGAAGYGVNTVTVEYNDGTSHSDSAATGLSGIKYGTKVTIAVTLAAPLATGQTVAPVVEKDGDATTKVATKFVGVDAAGKYLYTFDMPDFNVKVSAKVALPEYTVTVTNTTGLASVTTTGTTSFSTLTGQTDWTADLVVTPTADPGYTVTGATVTNTATGADVTYDWNTTNVGAVTVEDSDGAGKNVTITFTVVKDAPVTEVTVVVDADMQAAVSNILAGQSEVVPGATTPSVPPLAANGKVDLEGQTSIWLQFTDSTLTPAVTVTGSAVATYRGVSSNVHSYQITGLKGGETITIVPGLAGRVALTNPATAADTAAVANTQYAIVKDDPSTILGAVTVIDTPAAVATALEAVNDNTTVTLGTVNTAQTYTAADNGKYLVAVESTGGKVTKVGSVLIDFNAPVAFTTAPTVAADGTVTAAAENGGNVKYTIVADDDAAAALMDGWTVATTETDVTDATTTWAAVATKLTATDNNKVLVVVEFATGTDRIVKVSTVATPDTITP